MRHASRLALPNACKRWVLCSRCVRCNGTVADTLPGVNRSCEGSDDIHVCVWPTQAARRAMGAGSELKVFDIDNKYGAEALKQLYHELVRGAHALPGLTLPTVTRCAPLLPAAPKSFCRVGPWTLTHNAPHAPTPEQLP